MKQLIYFLLFCLISCTSTNEKTNKTKEVIKNEQVKSFTFRKLNEKEVRSYQKDIRLFFDTIYKKINFNGSFLIAKNGQVLFSRTYGIANHDSDSQISDTTPIHVASVSKIFTALSILKLVENKEIELEKDIRFYLPEIPYENIRVIDLLTHRSGIPYYGYFPDSIIKSFSVFTNKNLLQVIHEQNAPLNFEPNTHFTYCNTNFALLACIVERVTKKKFPFALNDLVLKPLGLKNTFIYPYIPKNRTIAESYNSKNKLQKNTELDYIYGDKNIYTTALDLLKLGNALLKDEFISNDLKKQMWKGYSYEKPGKSNYGLGFRLREEKGKETFIFHTGWWHGNTACFAIMPKDSACMIVISNHYTKAVYAINKLSLRFNNYPFASLVDPNEDFVSATQEKEKAKKYSKNGK